MEMKCEKCQSAMTCDAGTCTCAACGHTMPMPAAEEGASEAAM